VSAQTADCVYRGGGKEGRGREGGRGERRGGSEGGNECVRTDVPCPHGRWDESAQMRVFYPQVTS
jgi:hypothetical protein